MWNHLRHLIAKDKVEIPEKKDIEKALKGGEEAAKDGDKKKKKFYKKLKRHIKKVDLRTNQLLEDKD